MGTKYQRPGGSYAGQAALANRTKYQDDAGATPKRAISSGKMDGDLNYLIDAVNETWDAVAGAGFASALPSQAGNAGKVPVTNGTTTNWQLVTGSTVQDKALGLGKLADIGTGKLVGSDGSGAVAVVSVGTGLSLTGGALSVSAPLPVGMVVPFAGAAAPAGWLLCAGQAVNRVTFAALFGVLGTTYGAGDGSTTFALPDLRGRTVFGVDSMGGTAANRLTTGGSGVAGMTLGASGGDERMPAHSHTVTDPGHSHSLIKMTVAGSTPVPSFGTGATPAAAGYATSTAVSGVTVDSAGSGTGQNVPPALVLNYMIKA